MTLKDPGGIHEACRARTRRLWRSFFVGSRPHALSDLGFRALGFVGLGSMCMG